MYLLLITGLMVADVQSATQKRTLEQIIDLGMKRGAKKEIPGLLAHDLGIDRSFVRRRIVIDDGKIEPSDALSIVCKPEEGRMVPVGLLWQETIPKGDGGYDAQNFYSSLKGELKSVTLGEVHGENGLLMSTEKTASIDDQLGKKFEAEMAKFLTVESLDIQGQ